MGHLDSQRSLPAFGADGGSPNEGVFSPDARKLRLAAEHKVAVLNAPEGYPARLRPGPRDVTTALEQGVAYDAVQLFVGSVDELHRLGPAAISAVKPGGLLWITYPKDGRAGTECDLPGTPSWVKRDVLGEITSITGYRPVAFVSIDALWTAMRFKRI